VELYYALRAALVPGTAEVHQRLGNTIHEAISTDVAGGATCYTLLSMLLECSATSSVFEVKVFNAVAQNQESAKPI